MRIIAKNTGMEGKGRNADSVHCLVGFPARRKGDEMTKTEALDLIDIAPCDSRPSRINPALTRADAVNIVRVGISRPTVPDPFNGLMEKRVWQVVYDQKRPKFEKPNKEITDPDTAADFAETTRRVNRPYDRTRDDDRMTERW